MSEASSTPATAPVSDRRPVPRGVIPRGLQMWLMVGVAAGMLMIIMLTGHSQPSPRVTSTSATPQLPGLSPDRLREFQDRLRTLDDRARADSTGEPSKNPPTNVRESEGGSRQQDPLVAERKRREYESLFAGNVVLSRRPPGEQPLGERDATARGSSVARDPSQPAAPNLDDVAEAVVRATTRYTPSAQQQQQNLPTAAATTIGMPATATAPSATARLTPANTNPISASAPMQKLLEGTIIDTVLTNRLDGDTASPVNCLVTNPVYSHSGQHVLIPAGSRVLGETKPVRSVGESRLAVAFHRLAFPDGRTVSLDQFGGLNQVGDAALRDQVNQHYWATFGAASAIGLISGLGQYLGTGGFGQGTGDRTIVIAGGFGNATAETTAHVMNRFLNRLPTITIREGHRVKVYLTSDLELPPYSEAGTAAPSMAGTRIR